jgi:hypothetical protein
MPARFVRLTYFVVATAFWVVAFLTEPLIIPPFFFVLAALSYVPLLHDFFLAIRV